jgi:PAS domain S-box-containing protein
MNVRNVKLTVLVVLTIGMSLTGLFVRFSGAGYVSIWDIVGPGLFFVLTLLYWRGWEFAAPLTVLFLAVGIGLLLPEPFVSERVSIFILLPAILAVLLAHPLWVIFSTLLPLLLLLYRTGWQGVYSDPVLLAAITTMVGILVVSRIVLERSRDEVDVARQYAEIQAHSLAVQRDALSDSEARYRLITEYTGDLVCLLDKLATFIYLSPSFRTVLGYEPAKLVGTYAFQLVHPADLAAVLFQWGQVQLTGRGQVTFRYQHADGSWRWFDASGALLHWQGATMAVIVGHNTTENRKLSAQLEHVQKMDSIGRLAGGIAHDFNNLLTVMLGHVELASSEVKQGDPVANEIAGMRQVLDQAQALTRQLLAFSRRQAINPQIVDLNSHVEQTSSLLQRLIGAQIVLQLRLANGLWPIKIDPSQLEQVLLNLAINARDAMPNGGQLEIRTANIELDATFVARQFDGQVGSHVLLQVIDTGTGMAAEVLQHLFEPFFTTKPPGQGTGMGLATCYGIVKQNNGVIWVESALGQGTTINICLPKATYTGSVEQEEAVVASIAHETTNAGNNKTVF